MPSLYSSPAPEQTRSEIVACGEVLKDLEESRAPVTTKYLIASQVLCRKPFATGVAPFQDFRMLIDLRNAIMHIKVATEGERHPGQRLTDALAQRGFAIPSKGPSSLPWFDRLMTPAVALWAHDSALAMIRALLDLVPVPDRYDPIQFFRQIFREYPPAR